MDKNLGHATAYAYAKAGGYQGTEQEFQAMLGNLAEDLNEIENISATASTLSPGSQATASYNNGVISLGIPQGAKGEQGEQGETGETPNLTIGTVTTGEAGSSASATISGTAEDPVLSMVIPRGDKGDQGVQGQDGRPGADPVAFTVSLPSASWSNGAQTVSDARFLTGNYCYMVYAAPSDTYAWQDADIYADDVTTAGQMTFHTDATPSSNLTAQVIRLEIAS